MTCTCSLRGLSNLMRTVMNASNMPGTRPSIGLRRPTNQDGVRSAGAGRFVGSQAGGLIHRDHANVILERN